MMKSGTTGSLNKPRSAKANHESDRTSAAARLQSYQRLGVGILELRPPPTNNDAAELGAFLKKLASRSA